MAFLNVSKIDYSLLSDVSPEDLDRIDLYHKALKELALENAHWRSNLVRFNRWDRTDRLWWIDYLEKNFGRLEIAQILFAKIFVIRVQNGKTF
jgi:hypothetical protein